jgi:hypothetical protein
MKWVKKRQIFLFSGHNIKYFCTTSFFTLSSTGGGAASRHPLRCSFGLSATSQQYFSLRTNQSPSISQQYFSLRTNQHQPSATSQTNRLLIHKTTSSSFPLYLWCW